MAERKSIRLEKQHLDTFERMVEDEKADNQSEAHRMLLNAGMREYGYRGGESSNTVLRSTIYKLAWLFSIAGVVGLGFTFAYPVPARLPSFAVLVFGIALYGVSEVLEDHEPAVSKRLKGLFGGEAA